MEKTVIIDTQRHTVEIESKIEGIQWILELITIYGNFNLLRIFCFIEDYLHIVNSGTDDLYLNSNVWTRTIKIYDRSSDREPYVDIVTHINKNGTVRLHFLPTVPVVHTKDTGNHYVIYDIL